MMTVEEIKAAVLDGTMVPTCDQELVDTIGCLDDADLRQLAEGPVGSFSATAAVLEVLAREWGVCEPCEDCETWTETDDLDEGLCADCCGTHA